MTTATAPQILDLASAEAMPEEISQIQVITRRFLRHRLAVVSLIVLALIIVLAVIAPLIAPFSPTEIVVGNDFLAPGTPAADGVRVHWLGTDQIGRDYLSRLLFAARISLTVAVTAQICAVTIGAVVGAISGYMGGTVDAIVMRTVEFLLTIPQLPLLLIISSLVIQNQDAIPVPEALKSFVGWLLIIQPRDATQVVLVIAILVAFGWMGDSRLMRGVVLSVKEQTFTEAARALGASDLRIILTHMIPNALAPMIVSASLGLSGFIIYEAALSFLGLGIQDPTPTWGNMLSAAQSQMFQHPWLPLVSGIPIFLCSLAFNFVGDGLRDALDPRLKL
ncbi:MAG: ABC transporter permease [Anaerolineales bacterium]|nr:ABC transporter permease [Anaerolineales bacterium]